MTEVGGLLPAPSVRRSPFVDMRPYLPLLLAVPLLAVYLWLFVLPMANLLVTSFFGFSRREGIIHVLTLENYVRFWSDPYYWTVLLRTVKVSFITTFVSLVIGYPVAIYAARASPRVRGYVLMLMLSPLLISVVARTFGWVVILGSGGIAGWLGGALGQADKGLLYTEGAVVIGLVNVYLPFMVLSIYAALMNIDPILYRAAANLGASPADTFFRVTLPLTLPGMLAGSVIVLSLAASAFITPTVLGGTQNAVLTYLVFQQNTVLMNWPFGAVMAFALLALVTLFVVVNTRLVERGRYTVLFQ